MLLPGCGYHLGGVKSRALEGVHTVCINMFANESLYPYVAIQLNAALGEQLQRDGVFRLASPSNCDAVLSGAVVSVSAGSLRTNSSNTYLSAEIGLTVNVSYTLTDTRSGKVLSHGEVSAEGSYFNSGSDNVQTARDSALSYATRLAAEQIVQNMTLP